MTDVLLIRHGLTVGNVKRMIIGRGTDPLNPDGEAQAGRLSSFLKGVELAAIYSSPSKRTLQTARIILGDRNSTPLIEEAAVDEIDTGRWVGRCIDEVMSCESFNDYMYHPTTFTPPGGEPLIDVVTRTSGAIDRIVKKHKGGRVAVVSHADVIKAVLTHYLGVSLDNWQSFEINNASLSILRFKDGARPRLVVVNCHGDIERYCG